VRENMEIGTECGETTIHGMETVEAFKTLVSTPVIAR